MSDLSSIVEAGGLGGDEAASRDAMSSLKLASEPQGRLAVINEWCSEFCSSILVKETRQALKSRQFIWTYFLLLLCVGVWTVLGLTMNDNYRDLDYRVGRELLMGFWVILGFPLGLIIPFGAYRSMAREFEDGTIQLMSITTMKPYQIVMGKFGSAMLQMLTYLSVLAPCILFTYMLRGISLSQIVLGLAVCVGGSICLTILGLFLAGAVRSRALSIGASVLFVLLLGWLYYGWCALSYNMTEYGGAITTNEPEFWLATYTIVFLFGSTAVLLLVTAASQISFPSDNRSTAIRIGMMVQQTLFIGVVVAALPTVFRFRVDFCLAMTFIIGHYWLFMGMLMCGENPFISRRVQRTLPRSIFSRSLFSFFMPGSGRGFLFAVCNLWACSLILLLASGFDEVLFSKEVLGQFDARWNSVTMPTRAGLWPEAVISTLTSCLFVTWFLSMVFLAIRYLFLKKMADWPPGTGPMVSLLMGAIMVATISIGSFILHFNLVDYDMRDESSGWLVPNWYWATTEISQGQSYFDQLLFVVPFFGIACATSLVAIVMAARDLLEKPIEVPERVKIELRRNPRKLAEGESIDEIFGELKE